VRELSCERAGEERKVVDSMVKRADGRERKGRYEREKEGRETGSWFWNEGRSCSERERAKERKKRKEPSACGVYDRERERE